MLGFENLIHLDDEIIAEERLKKGFELEEFAKKLSGFRFTDKDKEGFILE